MIMSGLCTMIEKIYNLSNRVISFELIGGHRIARQK